MKQAFIFPGQGSQKPGMGREISGAFPAAREVLEEVDDTLSQKLSRLMFEGPEDELTLTENAQPAIMALSMAIFRVLQKEAGLDLSRHAAYVAGHSLGEYTALCAAGTFSLSQTARLLKLRGKAMQAAVPHGEGAMAAIIGLDVDVVEDIVKQAAEASDEICVVANYNSPAQLVMSGHASAVEQAMTLAKEMGAKRALPLAVSAPFHCPLMQPAAEAMRAALAAEDMHNPVTPLVANVTAQAVSDAETIRDLLVDQVTGSVRWQQSVHYMRKQGVEKLVEIGGGKVLTGLGKRIEPEMESVCVQTPADIEGFAKGL